MTVCVYVCVSKSNRITVVTGEGVRGYKTFRHPGYYLFRVVMTTQRERERESTSRSGQQVLANESRPKPALIGDNELRFRYMETGCNRQKTEVIQVKRQEINLV